MIGLWIFLSVLCVCATFLYWSSKYINPVSTPDKCGTIQDVADEDQPVNFDKIIAEVYDRLEEEK